MEKEKIKGWTKEGVREIEEEGWEAFLKASAVHYGLLRLREYYITEDEEGEEREEVTTEEIPYAIVEVNGQRFYILPGGSFIKEEDFDKYLEIFTELIKEESDFSYVAYDY